MTNPDALFRAALEAMPADVLLDLADDLEQAIYSDEVRELDPSSDQMAYVQEAVVLRLRREVESRYRYAAEVVDGLRRP
ncbi:hypothetical protein [Pseudonocardia charpentierae]|uniref:Uncharacterized protein n=1 Tax=Pseudonocardia charpentierae TaxID=3075545 RepID=A0ABU2NID7_9PSEU|nr:hypothetical protein [Pseudonocardia sp. DSM 45834]MDT0353737.1 hypothetical protein [Pseudonocardia sp. DSM 45834]